eukprot:scaffold106605_cov39-Cyclotella_meneghiniana.AAC.1
MFAHLQISFDVVGVKFLTPFPSSLRSPVSQNQGSRRAMALLPRKLRVSSSKRGKATGLGEACSNALAPTCVLRGRAQRFPPLPAKPQAVHSASGNTSDASENASDASQR